MRYQANIVALINEVVSLRAAPWILRVLLHLEREQGSAELQGFTKQEVIDAVRLKFRDKLRKDPPSVDNIQDDLKFLGTQGLITSLEEKLLLTDRGRQIARELTPAVTFV